MDDALETVSVEPSIWTHNMLRSGEFSGSLCQCPDSILVERILL